MRKGISGKQRKEGTLTSLFTSVVITAFYNTLLNERKENGKSDRKKRKKT